MEPFDGRRLHRTSKWSGQAGFRVLIGLLVYFSAASSSCLLHATSLTVSVGVVAHTLDGGGRDGHVYSGGTSTGVWGVVSCSRVDGGPTRTTGL